MKKTLLALTALITLAASGAKAQSFSYNETNNLLYFANRVPQVNQLNPALFPANNTFYLQLPGMNGLQFGFPLSIGDIAKYDAAQNMNIIDLNSILNTLNNSSQFRVGLDVNLLGFGFKVHNLFFDFNTQLRGNVNFGLPVSVVNTLLQGNVDGDQPIPSATLLDGSLFNSQFYLETSLGAGFRLPVIPLTIGVHAKLLSGLFNVQMDNTNITFETDEDFNTVRAKVYYELVAASALNIDTTGGFGNIPQNLVSSLKDNPMDAVRNLFDLAGGNTGVAFDIGARYDMGPLTVSASINDLSAGIHWQKNLVAVVPNGGEAALEFSGIDLGNLLDNGNFDVDTLSTYLNSQVSKLEPSLKVDEGEYWYNIPTKINLAATVNLGLVKAGLLFHGQFDRGLLSKNTYSTVADAAGDLSHNYGELKNTFRFNTTLSAGINLFNWFELIVGSSMVFDGNPISLSNFLNPGVGFVFTPATLLQAYVMMDYVSSIYLADMKAFNVKVGFNMLIGNGGKRKVLGF
ncbi:MAG: hypothetical protein IJ760_08590 [Bacteroidales bacterium]|nr:hypothetical protein [Bacteroidales bacterium]